MSNLLTLDLATAVGWSLGEPSDRRFKFGTHVLPSTGENIGKFLLAYDRWLRGMVANDVGAIVFESPVLSGKTTLVTLRKLYGLAGLTEMIAVEHGISVGEANAATVKKFVTGDGWAKKPAMLAAVRAFGFDVLDYDQADAIAVRLYALEKEYPAVARAMGLGLGLLGAAS